VAGSRALEQRVNRSRTSTTGHSGTSSSTVSSSGILGSLDFGATSHSGAARSTSAVGVGGDRLVGGPGIGARAGVPEPLREEGDSTGSSDGESNTADD
jgi:hypothetical protein